MSAAPQQSGEQLAFSQLYDHLRKLAAAHMRRERDGHTLQTTALVNEAWMRLGHEPTWKNRTHFFASASAAMRQILVDHARRRNAEKRGGGDMPVTFDDHLAPAGEPEYADILAVHQAIEKLSALSPRAARVVEMHFFGGMSFAEMAEALSVDVRTIKRDWAMARVWLREQLQ